MIFVVKAINVTQEKELAHKVMIADTLLKRMKGLLGRDRLEEGEALLIRPCNSIHTIGMKFPVDAVFLDRNATTVAVIENLLPNRITRLYLRASSVLELPAGTVAGTGTRTGDRIQVA